MYIVITCSLIAILLTYLDSRKIINGGMKWGFILVTLLAVIHYDYGNDYMAYYNLYKQIESFASLGDLISSDFYRDAGWSVVNYLFRYLGGFFSLVAVISIFQGVVFYKSINRFLPRHLWAFGIFIYLVTTSFYLLNFSMLRQGFVIASFLAVWPLIEKRQWWIVAPLLYLASFIHGSALILIPFAFWGYMPVRNGKTLILLYSLLLVALYFSSRLLSQIPQMVFESTDAFDYYEDIYSDSDATIHFGVGFLIYLIPTIISILYIGHKEANDEMKRMVALSCLVAFFTPLSQVIPMVGRVGMYFSVFRIIALPLSYDIIKNKPLKIILIALLCAILIFDYFKFFNSETFSLKYQTFHTIFEVL